MRRNAVLVGLALLLAGGMWFYVERILVPYQARDAAAHNRPRGNLSDLYPRWLGARELLLHGRDPYSPEITREIQSGFYGRPLDASLPEDPRDQQRFAYPVYVVFLLAPAIAFPFDLVQPVFLWLLVLLTGASVLLWLDFLQWRASFSIVTVVLLLTLGSFPVIQGAKLQQLSLLVGFVVALAAALLRRGHLFWSGALMAIAMIKPQLVVPVAGWFLLWALVNWGQRKAYVVGFATTMGILLAAAEWVLPGWFARFRDGLMAYRSYALDSGVLETLVSPVGGNVIKVLLIGVTIFLCWRVRSLRQDAAEFSVMTSLVLTTTVVILPMIVPYNQVLLLPSILWLAREWSQIWSRGWIARIFSAIGALMVGWPLLAAAALALFSAVYTAEQIQRAWALPLFSSLFIPLSVIALQFIGIQTSRLESPRTT